MYTLYVMVGVLVSGDITSSEFTRTELRMSWSASSLDSASSMLSRYLWMNFEIRVENSDGLSKSSSTTDFLTCSWALSRRTCYNIYSLQVWTRSKLDAIHFVFISAV